MIEKLDIYMQKQTNASGKLHSRSLQISEKMDTLENRYNKLRDNVQTKISSSLKDIVK